MVVVWHGCAPQAGIRDCIMTPCCKLVLAALF